jgi:N-acetylglucosamine-6-phosphate deacetylase
MKVLKARRIYTPDEVVLRGAALIEGGKIVAVGPHVEAPGEAEIVDFGDRSIVPGFIDIQIIGSLGHDVMQGDAGEAALGLAEVLPRFGVTGFLPTPVTAPVKELAERVASIRGAMRKQVGGARILGIHVEGPFFNPKRAGAQPPGSIVEPTPADCEALLRAADGDLKIISIAPEIPGALEAIRFFSQRGVVCSAAHTDATLDEFRAGVEEGIRLATHLYSAMRPFFHRDPGIIAGVWTEERVATSVIADLLHAHPTALAVARRMKGPRNLILITDAVGAAGLPDGEYSLAGQKVRLERGAMLLSGSRDDLANAVLAGSVLTMDQAVRNLALTLGWPLNEVLRYAAANPARIIGLEGRKGVIAPCADADLAVLNEDLTVFATIVGGEFVFQAG